MGGRLYFVWEKLIHPGEYKWEWLNEIVQRLKRASILSSHLLEFPGDLQSDNIFMSSLWVAENPEVGNVMYIYIYIYIYIYKKKTVC